MINTHSVNQNATNINILLLYNIHVHLVFKYYNCRPTVLISKLHMQLVQLQQYIFFIKNVKYCIKRVQSILVLLHIHHPQLLHTVTSHLTCPTLCMPHEDNHTNGPVAAMCMQDTCKVNCVVPHIETFVTSICCKFACSLVVKLTLLRYVLPWVHVHLGKLFHNSWE